MSEAYTRGELLAALEASGRQVSELFLAIPRSGFFDGTAESWGPAHHLGHLAFTHSRIAKLFRERLQISYHPHRRSQSFTMVRESYLQALGAIPDELKAMNSFGPPIDSARPPADLVRTFMTANHDLRMAVSAWTEEDLDAYAITHPLLGAVTGREMLFFCLYHDQHHLTGLRKRLAIPSPD
jgi:hypothetical protein